MGYLLFLINPTNQRAELLLNFIAISSVDKSTISIKIYFICFVKKRLSYYIIINKHDVFLILFYLLLNGCMTYPKLSKILKYQRPVFCCA